MNTEMKLAYCFIAGALMAVTRLFADRFVGRELAAFISIQAGMLFMVFAFSPTMKRALLIAPLMLLWGAGAFYVLDVRQDAIGFIALAACAVVIHYLIIRPMRRRELRQS